MYGIVFLLVSLISCLVIKEAYAHGCTSILSPISAHVFCEGDRSVVCAVDDKGSLEYGDQAVIEIIFEN